MPWDDSDDDFIDGFSWGLIFSPAGIVVCIILIGIVCAIRYYT
jgi:hypothetical protein